jgi:hypothetical protein
MTDKIRTDREIRSIAAENISNLTNAEYDRYLELPEVKKKNSRGFGASLTKNRFRGTS